MRSMKLFAIAALAWGVLIGSSHGQDDCTTPLVLTVNVPQQFDLSGATSQLPDPTCAANATLSGPRGDLWFSFTPAVTDCYQVGLGAFFAGTDSSVSVFVYTAPAAAGCPTDAELIACGASNAAPTLTAGQEYRIRLAPAAAATAPAQASVCVQGKASADPDQIFLDASTTNIPVGGTFTATVTPSFNQAVSALDLGLAYDDTKLDIVSITPGVPIPSVPNPPGPPLAGTWTFENPLINTISDGVATMGTGSPSALYGFTVFTTGGSLALPTEFQPMVVTFQVLAPAGDTTTISIGAGSTAADLAAVGPCASALSIGAGIELVPAGGSLLLTVVAPPMCVAPVDLQATLGLQGVTLSWTGDPGHDSYDVLRNGVVIGNIPGPNPATSFVDATVGAGTQSYVIRAHCGVDTMDSAPLVVPVAVYTAGLMALAADGLPVFLEFADGTVGGGSFGLRHNRDQLTATGHTTSAAFDALNGGAGIEFENFSIRSDAGGQIGVTYGFVTDFGADMLPPDELLPTGAPIELIRVLYDISAGAIAGVEPVLFADDLLQGPLPVPIAVTYRPTATGIAQQLPALSIDGSVLIAGFFIRGDLNDDDAVQLVDAIRLLEHLFVAGAPPAMCLDAGDINDDGSRSILDAIVLLTYLFGGGIAPPAPFPNCGLDPTPDLLDCVANTGSC